MRIRKRESKFVTLAVADRLLSTIGQTQAFHDGRITVIPNPGWSNEKYQTWLEAENRSCE
jgi:hypothetical protein